MTQTPIPHASTEPIQDFSHCHAGILAEARHAR